MVMIFILKKMMRPLRKMISPGASTCGRRIRKLRNEFSLTQEELAYELNLEGKSSISLYENDKRAMPADVVVALAQYFGTTTDYILNGDEGNPYVDEATNIIRKINSSRGKIAAIEHLKVILMLENS